MFFQGHESGKNEVQQTLSTSCCRTLYYEKLLSKNCGISSMHRHPPGGARGRGFGAQPFYVTPNRAGSVTGSIEGRMAAGRMMGARGRAGGPRANSSMDGSRMGSRHGCQMAIARFLESYVFGPSGFWTLAPLRYTAEFDPFLSLDCARVEGVGGAIQGKEGIQFCSVA